VDDGKEGVSEFGSGKVVSGASCASEIVESSLSIKARKSRTVVESG
jgi:hypothetical protein